MTSLSEPNAGDITDCPADIARASTGAVGHDGAEKLDELWQGTAVRFVR
jgi:hypothetical protein